MHRAAIHGIGIFSSVVVFGLLFEIATSQKESSVKQLFEQRRQEVDVLPVFWSNTVTSAGG